jgi:hypothetical protein
MNSHESRESRFDADESDGDRPADLARRRPSPAGDVEPQDTEGQDVGDRAVGPRCAGSEGDEPADAVATRRDGRGSDPRRPEDTGTRHPDADRDAEGRPGTDDDLGTDNGPGADGGEEDEDAAPQATFAEADVPFGPDQDDLAAARAARWDADDPRRKDDSFAPPTEPCECHCLHCGRTYSSEGIWFQRVINDPQGFKGFWMCPTANCSGAGFTFDIFPTDPDHPANEGWHSFDDEDEEDAAASTDADGDGSEGDEEDDGDDEDHDDLFGPPARSADDEEYDPAEPRYKELDAFYGEDDDDDDLEGEEWKYGLQPGERPADFGGGRGRREWEEEQRRYDEPDQRPRVLDWSDRPDRDDRRPGPGGGPYADDGQFKDDDIPF